MKSLMLDTWLHKVHKLKEVTRETSLTYTGLRQDTGGITSDFWFFLRSLLRRSLHDFINIQLNHF